MNGNEDKMSSMIDIMIDMMYQMRNVLTRQNRTDVKRSSPRLQYRATQEMTLRGSVTPVEGPCPKLKRPKEERLDMWTFHEIRPPVYQGERDYRVVDKWISKMKKIFEYLQCSEEKMVRYATSVLEGDVEE
ncbi:hypothetical protein ACLOJK_029489 [Asimina triloba]